MLMAVDRIAQIKHTVYSKNSFQLANSESDCTHKLVAPALNCGVWLLWCLCMFKGGYFFLRMSVGSVQCMCKCLCASCYICVINNC